MELIGLLNQSGTVLANILERNSQNLIVTLESHKSNILMRDNITIII